MKRLLLAVLCLCASGFGQAIPEGIGEGYDGELKHASSQLIALAEAMPADKFGWRPAVGVRSVSEVYMHIAVANFFFLASVGKQKMPPEFDENTEKNVTAKADVISWLKRSLDASMAAHKSETTASLQRKVTFLKRNTTADAVYLRLIAHCNEHMGQSVAYARMNGVVPPWSQ